MLLSILRFIRILDADFFPQIFLLYFIVGFPIFEMELFLRIELSSISKSMP